MMRTSARIGGPERALPGLVPARRLGRVELRERDLEVVRRMTPARKLAVMRALIRQAYELKTAAIRTFRSDLSEEQVQALARRLVGGDGP